MNATLITHLNAPRALAGSLRLLWREGAANLRDVTNYPPRSPTAPAVWIGLCAFSSCAGWGLSALHQLNALGYAVSFLLGLAAVWLLRRRLFPGGFGGWNPRKQRRRFRRTFPLAFLILAFLAILGGAIHAPSNYDALAYRVPRVLHWLAEGQWHWIYTGFQRVNTRACGIEWLSAPLIVLSKTDRLLFLINAWSFLLLPGLVFSLFRRVGVRPRVAWHWMWLLPTGYCYLLQAGSISNDMFSAVYALAAIDFALRARKSGRVSEVCLSVLAVALLTGAKTSNLPLLLPWAVAFVPTWRLWLIRPLAWVAIIPLALGASFLPMAVLNAVHGGDWSGAAMEHVQMGLGPVWLHLLANGITWPLDNLAPPVFPFASAWNRAADAITPASLAALFRKYLLEPGAVNWHLSETQVEESAGLGFGVTILLGLSLLAVLLGRRGRERPPAAQPCDLVAKLVCLAPWFSLLFVMTKLYSMGSVRYLASYYPLVSMGLLLGPAQEEVVRRNWWRSWAVFSCGLAVVLLVISPARPLWPEGWFFRHYGPRLQSSPLAMRAMDAYETKAKRAGVFAPMIAALPPDASVLGYSADDFPETSLWKPFGSRRILHVKLSDSTEAVRQRGIRYVLVTMGFANESWPEWRQRMDARELRTMTLKMWGSLPPFVWHLVELNPPGGQTEPGGGETPVLSFPGNAGMVVACERHSTIGPE